LTVHALKPEEYFVEAEPCYEPVGDEFTFFLVAYENQLPVLLKDPTGCGKTRFIEHMAWRLKRSGLEEGVSTRLLVYIQVSRARATRAPLNGAVRR